MVPNVLKCRKCGRSLRQGVRFCNGCGAAVPQGLLGISDADAALSKCPSGHVIDPSWPACPFCEVKPAWKTSPPASEVNSPTLSAHFPPSSTENLVGSSCHQSLNRIELKSHVAHPAIIRGLLATWTWQPTGQAFLLFIGQNLIGRGPRASISVEDVSLELDHALVLVNRSQVALEPCSNGLLKVNGQSVRHRQLLKVGDIILTGRTLWRFMPLLPPHESEQV